MRKGRVLSGALASLLLLGWTVPVSATHSLPTPRWWWDANNDGLRQESEGDRTYGEAGGNWTNGKRSRVSDATAAWRISTSWDPSFGTNPASGIHVDGSVCGGATWAQLDDAPAVNCVYADEKFNRKGTRYFDIYDSDIYINLYWSWHYADTQGPASYFDFEGIITHELGHGAFLEDLYGIDCGSPGYPVNTMCGTATIGGNGYILRTLTADDAASANSLY